MNYREVLSCRICAGPLENVLDLGVQHLAGQFPAEGEPDPPAFPLVLAHCKGACGLVQLTVTVQPELMFKDYWYRSGVTHTMLKHLLQISNEATELAGLFGRISGTILDIGCNDGTLLNCVHPLLQRTGIDPSSTAAVPEGATLIQDTYPSPKLGLTKFDLIFSIACFYDADDPVGFARCIKDNLAPEGLWCCEVADLHKMLTTGAYDGICHEHLCYYDYWTFASILSRAGLRITKLSQNGCNGGSLRFYVCHEESNYPKHGGVTALPTSREFLMNFVETVKRNRGALRQYVYTAYDNGEILHLLGASTKMNTVLQFCGLTGNHIDAASERDARKHGRRTPGTNIRIIPEEESREVGPDAYIVGPWHFRDEIVAREKEFLDHGGKLVLPLPKLEIISS